ncbi:MAG: GxxExxY protein [Phycisphaerae bacterium]
MSLEHETITDQVIGAAIEVHRALGPGLLESAYEQCLCHELTQRSIPFERQCALPVEYKGMALDCGYRIDLIVAGVVVVEIKAVSVIEPIHEAQLLLQRHFVIMAAETGVLDAPNAVSEAPKDHVAL